MTKASWKVINSCCLDYMATLPSDSVDLIFADYPFNCQDGRDDYEAFVKQTADEFKRILCDGGNLVAVNNPSQMFRTAEFFKPLSLRNSIALLRKGAFYPAYHYGFAHNYAHILTKGCFKKKWNGNKENHKKTQKDFLEYQNGYRFKGSWHPQAMPLDLVLMLVSDLSNDNDVVYDPFCGSGTTGVASVSLGRRFVGTEFNKKYAEMAVDRIKYELAIEGLGLGKPLPKTI